METSKPDVFLSYNREDHDAVETVARRLRDVGIEPWLDYKDWIFGPRLMDEIKTALDQCRICLVFIGPKRLGQWPYSETLALIQTEIYNRINKGVFNVIPVFLPGGHREDLSDLPAFVQSEQWVEFPELVNDEESFRQLLAAIREASRESGKAERQNSEQSARPNHKQSPIKPTRAVKKTILLPDIDWVEIPAGEFIYGWVETPAGEFIYGEASSKLTLTLDRFFIGRYLITNCQFQTFIDAGGYSDKRWWQDIEKSEPKESSWKQPNRPRETVDWYEALAFTRWLSAQLGFTITLPTEQQWEKAARGTDGREYPWGTDYKTGDANVDDASAVGDNLQQTTAVGLFPHRASPYQVMDMAGNVWEWCLNKYYQSEHLMPDRSNAMRVIRGGSLDSDPEDAYIFKIHGRGPEQRNYDLGFRVVCLSPYTEH